MINLLLFLIAIILFAIFSPFLIVYIVIDAVFTATMPIIGKLALVIDIGGNVLGAPLFNDILKTCNGYKFGNKKETISSVLGKNKRDGTLTKLGTSIANILDFLDKNHCIKSIDEMV